MNKIQRNLQIRIKNALQHFPVVVLIGARQVGKTELAKLVCPDWKYVDLENPTDLNRITLDPDFYFSENPASLILDEAQEYPELFKILRSVIDKDRGRKGRFVLTGSSSPELLENISESLAGRVATLEVGTLKANEFYEKPLSRFYDIFLSQQPLKPEKFQELTPALTIAEMRAFWFQGGYPEPTLAKNREFYLQWMEEYYKTYIDRDIRKLFPRINIQKYRKFVTLLSDLSGTILNRSELASLLEVSQPTVTQYLNIANGTFVWRTLPSFSKSKSKSLVKMPKGHVRDSGLLHFLTRAPNLAGLLDQASFGHSFESFAIEEILKGLTSAGVPNWNYSYYRTRSRAEIDLVIEGPFGLVPIEIKFGSRVNLRDLAHLNSFIKEYNCPLGLLVNSSEVVERLNPFVLQIPLGAL